MGSTLSDADIMPCDNQTQDVSPPEESIAQETNNPPSEELPEPEPSTSYAVEPVVNTPSEDPSAQKTSRNWDQSFEIIGGEAKDVPTEEQPPQIQLPNAIKMMVNMGWDGGALGATSSGILEPTKISRDKNNVPRAGFGHRVLVNNTKIPKLITLRIPCMNTRIANMEMRVGHRPQVDFRELFLAQVLDFVALNFEEIRIELVPGINCDDMKFIANVLHSLAARRCDIKLEQHEQIIFDNILVLFESQPDMFVMSFVPCPENSYNLNRKNNQGVRCHSIEARVKRFEDAMVTGKPLPSKTRDLMLEYGPLAYLERVYDDQTLTIKYLLELLELLKDPTQMVTFFGLSLKCRQKDILRDAVMNINENVCKYSDISPEAVLFKLIREQMERYNVNLDVCDRGWCISMFKRPKQSLLSDSKYCGYNYSPFDDWYPPPEESDEDDQNNEEPPDLIYDDIDTDNEVKHEEKLECHEKDDENLVKHDEPKQKALIDKESDYGSETLSEGDSDSETSTSDEDEKETNTDVITESDISRIASNVHSDEQTQAEDYDIKFVYVTTEDDYYTDKRKHIQEVIVSAIETSAELPYLICHGARGDAVMYSCQTKNSYVWLLKTCKNRCLKSYTKESDDHILSLKMNCFDKIEDDKLLHLLQIYNEEISIKDWSVLKNVFIDNCLFADVKMDQKSFNFILDSEMVLFAGIDTAVFSIIM